MPTINELMNHNVTTAKPDQTLEQAAQAMDERKVGAAVVLAQEKVVGIVTERDVLKAVARGMVPWTTAIDEIMTKEPLLATPQMDAFDAIALMLEHGFRHLPVVDGERLVGIVSQRHLLRAVDHPANRPAATG